MVTQCYGGQTLDLPRSGARVGSGLWTVWYKTKAGSQNFGYNCGVFFVTYAMFSKICQYDSDIWRATNSGRFKREITPKAGKFFFSKYEPQWIRWCVPLDVKFHWAQCVKLKAVKNGWSQFQSVSNEPLKLCVIYRCGLLLLAAIWQKNQHQALC